MTGHVDPSGPDSVPDPTNSDICCTASNDVDAGAEETGSDACGSKQNRGEEMGAPEMDATEAQFLNNNHVCEAAYTR